MRKPECILVVDDDPDVLRALERTLKLMGEKVWTAQDGEQALDELPDHVETDLVVTDYEMPFVKGDELCRLVKDLYKVPVILLSGNVRVHEVARACGADASHLKPVSNSDLQASIEKLFSRDEEKAGNRICCYCDGDDGVHRNIERIDGVWIGCPGGDVRLLEELVQRLLERVGTETSLGMAIESKLRLFHERRERILKEKR
jgi:CheY-like chemotaxis protein